MTGAHLVTTLGNIDAAQAGCILAHEHIFANFAADDDHETDARAVVAQMLPLLQDAQRTGVTVLVDATAIGAARRADILLEISHASGLPILVATGLFKEPAKTSWLQAHGEDGLAAWMTRELTESVIGANVPAGWIKISVNDAGVQQHEAALIRAAARASRMTNAVVGSHTVGAALAHAQLDLFEAAGGAPDRFIWIHTQTEPDVAQHERFARRGAWIEYDAIDEDRPDEVYLRWIVRGFERGYAEHVLLSHDRSGYNPTLPNGGTARPYTYLVESFLPKLREYGFGEDAIHQLSRDNPLNAYAR